MDRVQMNGGTAGLGAAVLLAVLFIAFAASGLNPQVGADPTKAIPLFAEKSSLFGLIGILGAVSAGLGIMFAIGIYARLREKAPTRASTSLGLALVGLTGHALGSLLLWQGGPSLVSVFSRDQAAASSAWLALNATIAGLNGLGNAFLGASFLIAGWAIVATGVMSSTSGWFAVVAGVVTLLSLFSTAPILFLAVFILSIVWLAWGGSQLRRAV